MNEFEMAMQRNPHLKEYVQTFRKETNTTPEFMQKLSGDLPQFPNIILPVGDPIFIHLYGTEKLGHIRYYAIEPKLSQEEQEKYNTIKNKILEKAPNEPVPASETELRAQIAKLLNESVIVGTGGAVANRKNVVERLGFAAIDRKVPLTQFEYNKIAYYLERDIVGSGAIEPVIRDPYLEDIHSIGVNNIYIIHKKYGMLRTNLDFGEQKALDNWMRSMSERIGRPVSESTPIADGALPDGSRINIIYSEDVSIAGSSFTMRKFSEESISIIQLIKWGGINTEMAAYLWLCLENGMSIFFSGETASGKTTMLNACLCFIQENSKIYSIEDTPEVLPPHEVWQRLITRESGPQESRVDTFTLLKAALRSRPNYIIVGEIRGAEGATAFQAMQTGHPVIATFHASAVKKMIQRLTGDPINIPVTFIDNLNVAMILQAVYVKGKFLRRCLSIEEIEGYYEDVGGVVTRAVFKWDPETDVHHFRGLNNSFILEDKIAKIQGYEDTRKIYDDLFLRARILDEMVNRDIEQYDEVYEIIKNFVKHGVDGLPFPI